MKAITRHEVRLAAVALILLFVCLSACVEKKNEQVEAQLEVKNTFAVPQIPYAPGQYVCYQTDVPLTIDGKLSEKAWANADWTDAFVDIEGDLKPLPRFVTRAKMLWDETYFYCCGEIHEPDVWATLTDRDAIIFYDNDFEVFIDPDGDSHEYYELEVNAFSTEWDLFLVKPYRDGGPALHSWDIQELKTAVDVQGTINRPGDTDTGWTIEIAIPWTVLRECAHKDAPPHDGDQWRVNFSRVEWQVEVEDGKYRKVTDTATGKSLPEDNWVWSPQGLINMHYPEMWGMVQFSDAVAGEAGADFVVDPLGEVRWMLRQVYYRQRDYFEREGRYAADATSLGLADHSATGYSWPPVIKVTPSQFEARVSIPGDSVMVYITQDGRIHVSEE